MANLAKYPPWRGDQPPADNLAKVDDELWERHSIARARVRDELGITVTVVSAWRDTAKQAQLYKCYQDRVRTGKCACGSCNLAAVPGTSNHERGLALDLNPGVRSLPDANRIYYELGLFGPVKPEDWHYELRPDREALAGQPPPPPPQEVRTMHLISNLDGRMEEFDVFLGTVVHRWQEANLQDWSPFVPFPALPDGQLVVDCAPGITKDGRLEVVARAGGGMRYRCWQKAPGREFDSWVPA